MVIVLSAPAGYGKTTLLAQWARADARCFAWVNVADDDNDPSVLVGYIVRALDAVDALSAGALAELIDPERAIEDVLLLLATAVSEAEVDFVLVLDDVHRLRAPEATQVLAALTDNIPAGSQLVLSGRTDPALPVGRLRANGRLSRFGVEDLALSDDEARAVLGNAGIELRPEVLDVLLDRVDGWPAGLYLSTLTIKAAPDHDAGARNFSGSDRHVAEFLRDELMFDLAPERRDFLLRTAALERLTGPLCDAVRETGDSGTVLEELAAANVFVIPLERSGEWYRYHHLFREFLVAELHHTDADALRRLHERASAWYLEALDFDAAIRHLTAAGSTEAAAALVWQQAPRMFGIGAGHVVGGWLSRFAPETIASVDELVLAAAWCSATSLDTAPLEHWIARAERADPDLVLSDGSTMRAATALLRASVGLKGPAEVGRDAAVADDLLPSDLLWVVMAKQMRGVGARGEGDRDTARKRFEEAIVLSGTRAPVCRTMCMAQLAFMEIEDGEWTEAARFITAARREARDRDLVRHPAQAPVYAAAAMLAAQTGTEQEARDEWKQARSVLDFPRHVGLWFTIEVRYVLARVSLRLGDFADARELVHEAQRIARDNPPWSGVNDRFADVVRSVEMGETSTNVLVAPLTSAELRILRYLPSHLTLAAIADDLFVSRNTAKTHVISVYRKLGVSSREAAVQAARDLGLLT